MADSISLFGRGMKIGLGYDRLTGDPSPSRAIAWSSITGIVGARGQQVTSDCLIIEGVEVLHKAVE
jgi:hypothetical protein